MTWTPADFLIARTTGPTTVAGYVYRGLGLHVASPAKRRRPPTWDLAHLGTGHSLCLIFGRVATAFLIATEIAECGDWDFDGLRGYINRDPDICMRLDEILAKHNKECSSPSDPLPSEDIARAIAMARAE